ncbi:MAG: type II toxin-antitoxin system ParD family antitoxin [Planctomycetes bacterium]|nr:type II toxin-antitoxin system ParD family antitoxin [Planctomycetota bacterium]MBU4398172.1 type II toxin-antitoxin system ParD family antitoxin [Planctomycetota bacterium]MCG2685212.1 type II toxin-antitoxin system ParD family antitoxin [Planctomycetales bacterium]
MTVEIPSEFQRFVNQVIDGGSYTTESEVVGDALRLLQQRRQRIEELRREIQPALDQLDRGEGIELKNEEELDAFFEDIKSRGRARLAAERESQ